MATGKKKPTTWAVWVVAALFVWLVIASRPTESDRLYKAGVEAENCADYVGAVTCFGEAVTRKPDFAEAWCRLGGCYWNLNRFVEAADSFDQAIHLKPGFTRAYIGLADSLVSLRQYSGAANALEQALRLDTDRADVLYELAICYRALGRGAEADAAYNKARQVNPQAVAFMDRAAAEGRL